MKELERKFRACPAWAVVLAGAMILFTCGFTTALVGIDYEAHNEIAMMLRLRHPLETFRDHPEPMWHLMVYLLVKLTHMRLEIAAAIVSGMFVLFAYAVSYAVLRKSMPELEGSVIAFMCILLHIVIAIYVPWFNKEPYMGQGSPTVWHNCTSIAVKPFALLAFLMTVDIIEECRLSGFSKSVPVSKGVGLGVMLLLSCLAKPSFVQIYYPAIFTLMVIWLIVYHKENFRMALQLVAVCVPSLLLTILQFVLAFYGTNKHAGGVTIAPFVVAKQFSPNIWISMLLAMAFPLFMLVAAAIDKKVGWSEIFAWILLGWGILWRLLMSEKGDRAAHGNFTWGYILGLYLVWFVGIRSYLKMYWDGEGAQNSRGPVFWIATVLLALHSLSGVYYLIYMIFLGHGL